MKTQCNAKTFPFQSETSRQVVAKFDGGTITSDAGGLLLQQTERLTGIISQIRGQWPEVRIIIRADSGFCREPIMSWCESHDVDYILGLAQNERLKGEIASEMEQAIEIYQQTGQAARVFKDFAYQTLDSWSCSRRVIGKAEYLAKGENPRFVVTSLSKEEIDARKGQAQPQKPCERTTGSAPCPSDHKKTAHHAAP